MQPMLMLLMPPVSTAPVNKRGGMGPFIPYMPPPTWNPLSFSGVTRDVNANPLGGCTVKLFRTSDNALMQTTVSDGSGNYSFQQVGIGSLYYVVAYLPGSPDVAGTTVRTLAGS